MGSLTSKAARTSGGGYVDPEDTNQDGVVSATEALVYSLKHPETALAQKLQAPSRNPGSTSAQTAWARYTAKGTSNTGSPSLAGSLDLYA
jgi:hypothetical protein